MKNFSLMNALLLLSLSVTAAPLFADTSGSASTTANSFANDAARLAAKTGNLIKDSAITGYIYTQIALDKNLPKSNVTVSTDHGKVTLEGTVNSDTEASAVIQLASSAAGVTSVDASKLKVPQSSQPFTDLVITAKVKGTFIRENIFDNKDMPADISVETKNGVVYLSGKASSGEQISHAVNLAKAISGVSRVESTIKLMQ